MIKSIIFILVLIYASYYDIKHLTVPTHLHILLFLTGLLNVSLLSIKGLVVAFIPMFLSALVVGGIGGGDVKISAMCGWVMQGFNGLVGVTIGIVLASLIVPIISKIKKQTKQKPFALVPYISAGCIIILLGGTFI